MNVTTYTLDKDVDRDIEGRIEVSTANGTFENAVPERVLDADDLEYERKAVILNDTLREIGMGRYQWGLFVVTGFGYFSDNLWPIVTGLILPAVVNEFKFNPPFLKLGQNVGLLIGAAFWGVVADIWGRRISFNLTLLITGIFALAAGGSSNFVALSALAGVWSIGVGGNLPVDSAIFLEFVPSTHQYLLAVLSIWWGFGQLIGSLIAWPLITNFSCPSDSESCPRPYNMGWRYFLFTMSGLMVVLWSIRFFLFKLYESPKWLLGVGRGMEACDILRAVARVNGFKGVLQFPDFDMTTGVDGENDRKIVTPRKALLWRDSLAVLRTKLEMVDLDHVRPLFATRKTAYSTSLLISLWALIGLAFPLYNSFVTYYLATRGADFGDGSVYITYRNQVILSVIGVPGALLAGYMVEIPALGRRGTLATATLLTGVFILGSTTARSSASLLLWNCAYSFTSNVMYGVLYALTPELLCTKHRGTGNALCASANRVFGIMAPVIALYADLTTPVPIFIAGGLFIIAGFIPAFLPYESRGKAAL